MLLKPTHYINIVKLRASKVYLSILTHFNNSTSFEGHNWVDKRSNVKDSSIGMGTYIGANCILSATQIGRYCSISKQVEVVTNNHPLNYVSTHPSFYLCNDDIVKKLGFSYCTVDSITSQKQASDKYRVVIGNDVWIGANVLLIEGVEIGNGAVIAAGSVVTKNVEPYSIVGGVPAKHIRYRCNDVDRDILNRSKWWDREPDTLKEEVSMFFDIQNYIGYLDKKND